MLKNNLLHFLTQFTSRRSNNSHLSSSNFLDVNVTIIIIITSLIIQQTTSNATAFSQNHHSRGDIPSADSKLDINVHSSERDGAAINRGGAIAANGVDVLLHKKFLDDAKRRLDGGLIASAGKVVSDKGILELGDAAGALGGNRHAIEEGASAFDCGEELVHERQEDDAEHGLFVDGKSDGDAAIEGAVHEGGGAVDGVDDPSGNILDGGVGAGFFRQKTESGGGG